MMCRDCVVDFFATCQHLALFCLIISFTAYSSQNLKMHSFIQFITVALCFFSAALVNAAVLPRASDTCRSYTCPPADKTNDPFVGPIIEPSAGVIQCRYPGAAGVNSQDYFCKYKKDTGVLLEDHDQGQCLPATCAGRRGRPGHKRMETDLD